MSYEAMAAVLESIGRALICLDETFHVVHASPMPGISDIAGRPIADLLGEELFGSAGTLRALLERGERREGWRATMQCADGPRTMSMIAAPFARGGVRYILVLQPAEQDPQIRSAPMTAILELVWSLHASEAAVLLTGERGTGKEWLARAIHANSPRRYGRFVAVHCAALPDELIEAEQFGPAGGTLFLDDVNDLPLQSQATLLRALEERSTDARIIAAASVELRRAIAESRFREDLYHRLRAVPIEVPPLRARREDIEPLAAHFLTRAAARHSRELRFSPDAIRAMLRYRWPGNVRELENAIEYAVAVVEGQTIHAEDLPLEVAEISEGAADAATIRGALESHRWNREATARALGMSRTTLWRKMRELGLI